MDVREMAEDLIMALANGKAGDAMSIAECYLEEAYQLGYTAKRNVKKRDIENWIEKQAKLL